MAVLPCSADTSPDVLAQLVGRIISVVRTPLGTAAARLYQGGELEQPLLLLDPNATPEDQTRALLDALALVTIGPAATVSARRVRHLRVVS